MTNDERSLYMFVGVRVSTQQTAGTTNVVCMFVGVRVSAGLGWRPSKSGGVRPEPNDALETLKLDLDTNKHPRLGWAKPKPRIGCVECCSENDQPHEMVPFGFPFHKGVHPKLGMRPDHTNHRTLWILLAVEA